MACLIANNSGYQGKKFFIKECPLPAEVCYGGDDDVISNKGHHELPASNLKIPRHGEWILVEEPPDVFGRCQHDLHECHGCQRPPEGGASCHGGSGGSIRRKGDLYRAIAETVTDEYHKMEREGPDYHTRQLLNNKDTYNIHGQQDGGDINNIYHSIRAKSRDAPPGLCRTPASSYPARCGHANHANIQHHGEAHTLRSLPRTPVHRVIPGTLPGTLPHPGPGTLALLPTGGAPSRPPAPRCVCGRCGDRTAALALLSTGEADRQKQSRLHRWMEDVERRYRERERLKQGGRLLGKREVKFIEARLKHGPLDLEIYNSHSQINEYFLWLDDTFPFCATINIGATEIGRSMLVLQVGEVDPVTRGKKAVWIDSGFNGQEWIPPATTIYLVYRLVSAIARGVVPIIELVRRLNIYILPVANPDDYERARGQVQGAVVGRRLVRQRSDGKVYMRNIREFIWKFRDMFIAYLAFHRYRQKSPCKSHHHLKCGQRLMTPGTLSRGLPDCETCDDWAKGVAGIKYSYSVELGEEREQDDNPLLAESNILSTGEEIFSALGTLLSTVIEKEGLTDPHEERSPLRTHPSQTTSQRYLQAGDGYSDTEEEPTEIDYLAEAFPEDTEGYPGSELGRRGGILRDSGRKKVRFGRNPPPQEIPAVAPRRSRRRRQVYTGEDGEAGLEGHHTARLGREGEYGDDGGSVFGGSALSGRTGSTRHRTRGGSGGRGDMGDGMSLPGEMHHSYPEDYPGSAPRGPRQPRGIMKAPPADPLDDYRAEATRRYVEELPDLGELVYPDYPEYPDYPDLGYDEGLSAGVDNMSIHGAGEMPDHAPLPRGLPQHGGAGMRVPGGPPPGEQGAVPGGVPTRPGGSARRTGQVGEQDIIYADLEQSLLGIPSGGQAGPQSQGAEPYPGDPGLFGYPGLAGMGTAAQDAHRKQVHTIQNVPKTNGVTKLHVQSMPQIPGVPQAPGMPNMPSVPQVVGMPNMPSVPPVAGMPNMPSVPQPPMPSSQHSSFAVKNQQAPSGHPAHLQGHMQSVHAQTPHPGYHPGHVQAAHAQAPHPGTQLLSSSESAESRAALQSLINAGAQQLPGGNYVTSLVDLHMQNGGGVPSHPQQIM